MLQCLDLAVPKQIDLPEQCPDKLSVEKVVVGNSVAIRVATYICKSGKKPEAIFGRRSLSAFARPGLEAPQGPVISIIHLRYGCTPPAQQLTLVDPLLCTFFSNAYDRQ